MAMTTVLFIIVALLVGLLAGCIFSQNFAQRKRRRARALRAGEKEKKTETMKKVVWVCLFNGITWVWCSYILAALDKVQIAESLSQVAVTEIVGVVLAYALKSVIENLSKNNNWPDKGQSPSDEPPDSSSCG